MPTIDRCPLCEKNDCIVEVRFTIDGVQYRAYKCKYTNNILYSNSVENEKNMNDFIEKFDKLAYFNQTSNN